MNELGYRWSRLIPGLITVGLVLVSVLLIAGYGVPVGIGLIAGFMIGLAIGVIGAAWSRSLRTPSSVTFGRRITPSEDPDTFDPPAAMRAMSRVQRVDHGPLERVVAGGTTADAAGIHVELIALEIRSSGAIAHIAAGASPPGSMFAPFAAVSVEDNIGTAYEAAGTGGNGSPDRMRYEVRFTPTPPIEASWIRFQIDAFVDPFPFASAEPVRGPWLLVVDVSMT